MKKIILIKNNKGGIGKTFVAINLADYLSKIKVNGNESKVLILTDDSQNNILMYSKNFSSDTFNLLHIIALFPIFFR